MNPDRRPLPTGPVVRLVVAVILLVLFVIRGRSLGVPPMALIVLALGLVLIAGEQVRRIWVARRPPAQERVSKHPLGLE
jgi:hypothetical protein